MLEASANSPIVIKTGNFLVEEIEYAETRLIVRGRMEDLRSWMDETGIRLPELPNTIAQSNIGRALWLGPDEWLIELHGGLFLIADGRQDSACIVNVSDYHKKLRFRGDCVREVISRVCPLDLRLSKFGRTNCAQTIFGEVNVILAHADGANGIDLYVARSLFSYVQSLISRMSLE